MKDRAAASRYARALEAALEGDVDLDRTAGELTVVASILLKDPATARVLLNPALSPSQRQALLGTIAAAARLSETTLRFVDLLGDRRDLALLPDIAAALGKIRDRRLGIVEAEVTTAVPLNGDLTARTQATLEKTTGRKVRLAFKTDPALIGGIVARVGSIVYDGSLRTQLEAMREHLARG